MTLKITKLAAGMVLALCVSTAGISAKSLLFQQVVRRTTLLEGQRYVVFSYGFTNKGGDVVNIKKIALSCGCMSYELSKETYTPGESGTINVKVDTLGKSGTAYAGVDFETDENDGTYELKGFVTMPNFTSISPRMLRWELGEDMKEKVVLVSIKNGGKGQTPLHIKNVIVNQEYFDVRVVTFKEGGSYFVYVRPKQKIKCSDDIEIITEPTGPPEGLHVMAYVYEKHDKL